METLPTHMHGESCADEVILKLSPKRYPVLEIIENGIHHYKTVGYHELLNILDRSIVVEQLKKPDVSIVSSPPLPERSLLVDTLQTQHWLRCIVTAWLPRMEYPLIFGEKTFLIPFPALVYQVTYEITGKESRKIHHLRLAVSTDDIVTHQSQLYRYPFSNVYPSGQVCWNGLPSRVGELHQMAPQSVFAFLATPNNHDLYGVGRSHNAPHTEYEDFLSAVVQEGVRPEWLIPMNMDVQTFHQKSKSH
ncbi:E2 family protein D [Alicyclobacillus tolerans]|uniref:E2 family protein D n=1 Tax=Alicyclobacillus tolerans TaxID=90970 RepID=A0A1M6WSL1_9BACL|nr:E2 family protein D [Alicyclobacillus montanus]